MNTELYTKLLEQGIDEATARKIAENSGASEGGNNMPFDVIKLNYDKEDILIDLGVKKGDFVTGFKIDKKNLEVKEKGKVFKQPLEFAVVSVNYQYSAYDPQKGGYKHITPLFENVFDANRIRDLKTGKTVKELKDAGEQLKFNVLLLLYVKEGKEFNPYFMYLRGTNYFYFNQQLEERGLGIGNLPMQKLLKVKSKKVPTKASPAWVIDIVDIQPFQASLVAGTLADVMNKFDNWKREFNSQRETEVVTPTTQVSKADDGYESGASGIDIDEDDLPF